MIIFKDRNLIEIYNELHLYYGPQHWWPGDSPFEVAIGAILTQNTSWTNVEKAIENLKKKRLLSSKALNEIPMKDLALLIRPAGYYNVKAKRLKAFVTFLVHYYRGSMKLMGKQDAHTLREKLLEIHGIGQETADSILLYAFEKPVFVVDAYTKRIFSRHGLVDANVSYEELQGFIHENLEEDVQLFNEYHALLVKVGKDRCRPKPICQGCPLFQ